MSIVSGFFNQIIDYIYSTDTNGWGDVTTTVVASNVHCRWQEGIKRIVSETEDVQKYSVEVWIDPQTVEEDYQVQKGSRTYRVIKVIDEYNILGIKDHVKLYLE